MVERHQQIEVDVLEVRDMAMDAMRSIQFHEKECDKRQLRIESAQKDIGDKVERMDGKISANTSGIYQRIDSITEKIGSLQVKVAVTMTTVLILREGIVALIAHHADKVSP